MLKKLFWVIFLAFVFVLAYKFVPIYYRAFSLDGICKENADLVHRYTIITIKGRLKDDLDKLGIPPSKRETALIKTKEEIVVKIYYEDTADFFGYYKKEFVFFEECNGVLYSVVAN